MATDESQHRGLRWLVAVVATAVAVALAARVWQRTRPLSTAPEVKAGGDSDEVAWRGTREIVVDDVAGFRGRRDVTLEFAMAALNGTTPQTIVRRQNNLGFLRDDDLAPPLPRPRIVLLGDSHMMGVVSTAQNAGPVLERLLRERGGWPQTLVLNAGCGFYSYWQYVLRARTLLREWQPEVLVVVAFTGNDFLDLDRTAVPHLDDELHEVAVEARGESDEIDRGSEQRRVALDLPRELPLGALLWQGLNQAAYFHERPDREAVIRRKAERCVLLLDEVAGAHGTRIVHALLPPLDLVFPEHARNASSGAREVVESGVQLAFHRWFRGMLAARGATVVDLLPVFAADGRLEIYAFDLHVFELGHRLLAEALVAPVERALQAR